MSLDPTQYPNRKDHRKPYHGAKAISHSCRNHGSCPWCKENRTIKNMRQVPADAKEQEKLNGD